MRYSQAFICWRQQSCSEQKRFKGSEARKKRVRDGPRKKEPWQPMLELCSKKTQSVIEGVFRGPSGKTSHQRKGEPLLVTMRKTCPRTGDPQHQEGTHAPEKVLPEPDRAQVVLQRNRHLKQAAQFVHKDSADLLPLDGLKRLGTSKDLVSRNDCIPFADSPLCSNIPGNLWVGRGTWHFF